jgi:peptidoglycan/xylan/chitin deacetylase (PgdA/CDA1 family)
MGSDAPRNLQELAAAPVDIVSGRRRDIVSRLDRMLARLVPATRKPLQLTAPLVSFTFDDVPDSAAVNGAAILERHGVRGTFYISGGLAGRRYEPWTFATPAALRPVVEAGHEVGCHTHSHPDMQRTSWAQIQSELARNSRFLADHFEITPRNFAYPYGSVGLFQKYRMAFRFDSCRGVYEGVNEGHLDLGQLRAVRLYDDLLGADGVERWLDEAAARQGWLIFYTHDVADPPSNQGSSPRLLEEAVGQALARGYQVVTVAEALRIANARSSRHEPTA